MKMDYKLFFVHSAKHLGLNNKDPNVTTIYLISFCHLDVEFANTAQNIVKEYGFDKYFPDAIKIARDLRNLGGEECLVFTTHPYLVYLYTNCLVASKLGLHCPSETQLQDFTDAVKRGDIVWHVFPFNAQMEFYDKTLAMADFGFQLTHKLDAKFGRNATVTMSHAERYSWDYQIDYPHHEKERSQSYYSRCKYCLNASCCSQCDQLERFSNRRSDNWDVAPSRLRRTARPFPRDCSGINGSTGFCYKERQHAVDHPLSLKCLRIMQHLGSYSQVQR